MSASDFRLTSARSSPGPKAIPALLTRMSRPPTSRSIVANIAFTWALSATSAWIARPPAGPFIDATVCSAVSSRSSLTMTCAPSSANKQRDRPAESRASTRHQRDPVLELHRPLTLGPSPHAVKESW